MRFIIPFLCLCLLNNLVKAQNPVLQTITQPGVWADVKGGLVARGVVVFAGNDTLTLPTFWKNSNVLAMKNGVVYTWDVATQRYIPVGGGGSNPDLFNYYTKAEANDLFKAKSYVPAWGTIVGTLTNQLDLQAALNAKQNTLPLGSALQYLRGNQTLGNFNDDVLALGNQTWAHLGHTHTAQHITDFNPAVRALFTGSQYISISNGQISYTGPVGGGTYNFAAPFVVSGSDVSLPAYPAANITGTKTPAFISGFDAQAVEATKNRYLDTAYASGSNLVFRKGGTVWQVAYSPVIDSIKYATQYWVNQTLAGYYTKTAADARYFSDLISLNDSTARFTRPNGTYKDLRISGTGTGSGSGGAVNLKRQQWKNSTATTYTLTSPYSGSFAAVFLNGIELDSADFTISGTTLTVGFTVKTTDRISVHYSY